jgi:uncharacterized protein involved in response to NO
MRGFQRRQRDIVPVAGRGVLRATKAAQEERDLSDEYRPSRRRAGPVLFSYGFRPFFLAAGLAAFILVPLWAWSLAAPAALPVAWPPSLWHAHEMVFGFAAAAIAGFLLTAVPSWTGRKGFAGWPLVLLFALWLAARLVVAASGLLPRVLVAAVSLSFLPLLMGLLAWPLLRERNRNTPLLFVLATLWVCQCAFHWAAWHSDFDASRQAVVTAINLVLVLVTVIGGRIVPSFTANALRLSGSKVLPRAANWLTPAAVTLMVGIVIVDVLRPGGALAGVVALAAAAVQAARISQRTAFFHLGELVEYGGTADIFTNPTQGRTQDYITGRYG